MTANAGSGGLRKGRAAGRNWPWSQRVCSPLREIRMELAEAWSETASSVKVFGSGRPLIAIARSADMGMFPALQVITALVLGYRVRGILGPEALRHNLDDPGRRRRSLFVNTCRIHSATRSIPADHCRYAPEPFRQDGGARRALRRAPAIAARGASGRQPPVVMCSSLVSVDSRGHVHDRDLRKIPKLPRVGARACPPSAPPHASGN